MHAHIAPFSYYCVFLLCCLEQWVASFDGLWPFWQLATAYKRPEKDDDGGFWTAPNVTSKQCSGVMFL